MSIPAGTLERLLGRVDRSGSCWLFTGTLYPNGYGQVKVSGRWWLVHRLAYELLRGPIPQGLEIDHLCRVRNCINPDHLEPVTPRVNRLRGVGATATNARKTHCPAGHPLIGENLYTAPDGRRQCRTCRRAHAKKMDAKRRADTAAGRSRHAREKGSE